MTLLGFSDHSLTFIKGIPHFVASRKWKVNFNVRNLGRRVGELA